MASKSPATKGKAKAPPVQILDLGRGRYAVKGELSFSTVAEALKKTSKLFGRGETVSFDLARVVRADSSGVALLIEWLRLARAAGQTVRFIHVPDQIRAMARVSGVEVFLGDPPESSETTA